MSRLRLVLLLGLVMVAAAACQVRSEVLVEVDDDGSGTVTATVELDADAAGRLGDPSSAIRLDDLRGAGWDVAEPESVDGGGLRLVGTREFAAADQLPVVLAEIGGVDGVFREVELSMTDGFATTEYDFSAKVELSGSLEQFSDPELAAALGGLPLARSPEELAAEGGTDTDSATLDVVVDLPGGAPETNGTVDGESATWSYSASGGTPTSETLRSTSSVSGGSTKVLLAVAAVALVLAIALAVVGLLRRRD